MEEELAALGDVWHHTFSYITSMSLKCAVDLRIPDAIHSHGGAITLPALAVALSVPPSKLPPLRRLMRTLVQTGCFSKRRLSDGGDETYSLTRLSALLVSSNSATVSPFVQGMLHPLLIDSWHSLGRWFRDDADGSPPTPFAADHGKRFFEAVRERREFAAEFNAAMASDSRTVGELLVKHHADVFDGARSMVDVGGCTGALAAIVAEAFPHVKCTVLDLPHVVASVAVDAQTPTNLDFVGGDMFELIPSADLLILKWILHAWNDEESIKILKRCKEAIPCRERGGKVVVIDIVLREEEATESPFFFDMLMMTVSGGIEREEREWKKIFAGAGFSEYKLRDLGVRSLIELYP
ncbi:trans-resveratrol di-O-methyltransferase-like [Zingiber officinale]|nr:trans-resveratrol di-O-methyltransferase-like [Zingiber officinale]